MEEYFVEYLLGSLDPVTRSRVDAHLAKHPEAKARLALLENALAPLAEDAVPPEPPPHLVLNTLARIAEHRCKLPPAPPPSRHQLGTPPRRWLRRADWLVAAILLFLVAGFGLPLLARQWHIQQRSACANNLRKFWVGLSAYADRSEGKFPVVEPEGPRGIAGIFAPLLTDVGFATDTSIQCPSHGHRSPINVSVAKLEDLYTNSPADYRAYAREIGGSYAYTLGYENADRVVGLRRDAGDGLPILADHAFDSGNSANHGGRGQNVLFVGGQVQWCTEPTAGSDRDHIYLNHQYRVRAGVCRTDSVLGGSDARPRVAGE